MHSACQTRVGISASPNSISWEAVFSKRAGAASRQAPNSGRVVRSLERPGSPNGPGKVHARILLLGGFDQNTQPHHDQSDCRTEIRGSKKGVAKGRRWRPFVRYQGYFLCAPDWLAGDAVLIAPVSNQIPWYQGILQGILRFWGSEIRFSTRKPLRCSHFSSDSLRRLSGKIF